MELFYFIIVPVEQFRIGFIYLSEMLKVILAEKVTYRVSSK